MTRDEIAKLFEQANGWNPGAFLNTMDDLGRFAALVAAAEREACAKVVENYALGYHEPTWAFKLIAAIRARGQA